MSIQLVVTGDTRPLDRIETGLQNFNERTLAILHDVAAEVFDEIRVAMLEALRFYPPVPAGSKYVRTFRLRRGWDVRLEFTGNGVFLVVRNATPYTRYVVGLLTTADAAARATQRAFHARNGWPVALDTTRYWFDIFKDAFIEAFIEAVFEDLSK